MLRRIGFVVAFSVAASAAAPAYAQLNDTPSGHRAAIHFLVRHENGRAVVKGLPFRQPERTVGLWRPEPRDELMDSRSGDEVRDLHSETVPLFEMEW